MNPDDYPEALEAAARALCVEDGNDPTLWPLYRDDARAALEAALPLLALDRDTIGQAILDAALAARPSGYRVEGVNSAWLLANAVVAASPLRTVTEYALDRDTIARAVADVLGPFDTVMNVRAESYALADAVVAASPLRTVTDAQAEALREACVRAAWTETLPNDGEFEYIVTSDCDGSNARYLRRKPRYVGGYRPWEPTSEDAYRAARLAGGEDR